MKYLNKLKELYRNTKTERILEINRYVCLLNTLEQNALFRKELSIDSKSEIIVSLTTYGKSLNTVYFTIESLLEQTVKPKKIVLWISDKTSDDEIPEILKLQATRGLEIKKTKDIGSYKKLIPTLIEYPNFPIITVDDDAIYPIDTIENLYKEYKKDKSKIYFRRGHKMKLNGKEFLPYRNFDFCIQTEDDSIYNFPTGVGGVLYPPFTSNVLDKEVLNEDLFLELAPYADDVWFKAMSLKANTISKKVYTRNPCYINLDFFFQNVKERLTYKNITQNKNDVQIKAVWDYFNLWEKYK